LPIETATSEEDRDELEPTEADIQFQRLTRERDHAYAEWLNARQERDDAEVERDEAKRERDIAREERNVALAERDRWRHAAAGARNLVELASCYI
jgi:hypothetical protein